MKKIIIIVALLLYSIGIHAQYNNNIDPKHMVFNFKDNAGVQHYQDSLKYSYFPQTKFIIGWQWGEHPKITREMHSNMGQTSNTTLDFSWQDNMDGATKDILSVAGNTTDLPYLAQSFLYEPTLLIPEESRGQFLTCADDPTNPIFGFSTRQGVTSNGRLVLNNPNLVGQTVLSNPWVNDRMICKKEEPLNNKNGINWYVSMCIRRKNFNDITEDDTPILEVTLPYKLLGSNAAQLPNIIFSYVPESDFHSNTSNNFNGNMVFYLNLKDTESDRFFITKRMLPHLGDGTNDIIISAFFQCNQEQNPNPPLIGTGTSSQIESIGFEAKYLSNECPVEIDWIRIETPYARDLFKGTFNENIRASVQTMINGIEGSKNYKFFRVYPMDGDDSEVVWNWGTLRYLNKLLNGFVTSSISPVYPKHYEHYVGGYERWANGIAFGKAVSSSVAAPYYRPNNMGESSETRNAGFSPSGGYRGYRYYNYSEIGSNETIRIRESNGSFTTINNVDVRPCFYRDDTTNSAYETHFHHDATPFARKNNPCDCQYPTEVTGAYKYVDLLANLKTCTEDEYIHYLKDNTRSYQGKSEFKLYDFYKNSDLLFSKQPFWMQIFEVSNWSYDPINNVAKNGDKRPLTGEESMHSIWTSILLGAKGVAYDRLRLLSSSIGITSCSDSELPNSTGDDFLYSDIVGTDFIDYSPNSNEVPYIKQGISQSNVSEFMQVKPNRIYLGRKSQRTAMKKLHDYIMANSDTLMGLKLVTWHAKGFKEWTTSDPASALSNYNYDYFISQPATYHIYGNKYEKEPYDSSFFDIAIHRYVPSDGSLGEFPKTFFIAVQNRRTDPLIIDDEIATRPDGTTYLNTDMKFYSSAEFDMFARNGGLTINGNDRGAAEWKSFWWKRRGCRRIRIPLVPHFNTTKYLLQEYKRYFSELGCGNTNLGSLWWRQRPLYRPASKFYDSISVDLLPGEGRLIKVWYTPYIWQERENSPTHHERSGKLTEHMKASLYTSTNCGDKAICFSKGTAPASNPSGEIVWGPKYALSFNIPIDSLCEEFYDIDKCSAPSMVSDYKGRTSDTSICRVVYAAKKDSNENIIVEHIVRTVGDSVWPGYGKIIARFNGNDLEKYGKPVISSGVNGFYYAWADSLYGIRAAWKAAGQEYFADSNVITVNFADSICPSCPKYSFSPNLNSYSHSGDSSCALAWSGGWQTAPNSPAMSEIFYTVLNKQQGKALANYMPTLQSPSLVSARASFDGKCVNLSKDNPGRQHISPKVVRMIDGSQSKVSDRVYWISALINNGRITNSYSAVKSLEFITMNKKPYKTTIGGTNLLISNRQNKLSFDVAQFYTDSVSPSNITQYVNLDFTSLDSSRYSLYNYKHTSQSIFANPAIMSVNVTALENSVCTASSSLMSMLSRSATIPNYSRRQNSRRYILYSDSTNVQSSPIYRSANLTEPEAFVGFSNGTSKAMSGLPIVAGAPIEFFSSNDSTKEFDPFIFPARIQSSPFTAETATLLEFKTSGTPAIGANFKLQRLSDSAEFNLVINGTVESNSAELNSFLLVNGGNDKYRLILESADTNLVYCEEVYLEGMPAGTANRKNNTNIVDLSNGKILQANNEDNILISPNPADQTVSIMFGIDNNSELKDSDYQYLLKLVSISGDLVYSSPIEIGQSVKLPTAEYSSGSYFVIIDCLNCNNGLNKLFVKKMNIIH